jgi:hypothetical protein
MKNTQTAIMGLANLSNEEGLFFILGHR